ncbi:MAG: hypothetical protein LUD15_09280 [Bacteroides sp.]|nr:hypothetical protein [Bacteroides sp.]
MIVVETAEGTDKKLYKLVAHLVMDPKVLKQNNNYPFKTSEKFLWFIARKKSKTIGFFPVERKGNSAVINNYYVEKNDPEVYDALMREVRKELEERYTIHVVAITEHKDFFIKHNMQPEKMWTKYVKLIMAK